MYRQQAKKINEYSYGRSKSDWGSSKSSTNSHLNKTKQRENSIISSTIHFKTSWRVKCMSWDFEFPLVTQDETILSLDFKSSREIKIKLKFYPIEPVDSKIMIDYEFKFKR